MADTPLDRADLLTDFATNTTNAIGSDDFRSIIKSIMDTFGGLSGTPVWTDPTDNTFSVVGFTDSAGTPVGDGVTADYVTDDDLVIDTGSEGSYFCIGHISGAFDDAVDLELAIHVDGTEDASTTARVTVAGSGADFQIVTMGMINLAAAQAVSLRMKNATGAAGVYTATNGSAGLYIFRVGDEV